MPLSKMRNILQVQQESLQEEREAVLKKMSVPRSSKLFGNDLVIDARGLLRIRTRIPEGTTFTSDEVCPVVLPHDSIGTRLVIEDMHKKLMHDGVSHMMAELRRRYYIVQCRKICRAVVRQCVVCRRYLHSQHVQPFAPSGDAHGRHKVL